MYIKQCYAGFGVPTSVGKCQIVGLAATISDPTLSSRITIIDDANLPRDAVQGRVLADSNQPVPVVDIKGLANIDATVYQQFEEPLQIRYGVSVINAQNLIGGRVFLYIR